ncbi:CotH kinase family protein [soil metagenome]
MKLKFIIYSILTFTCLLIITFFPAFAQSTLESSYLPIVIIDTKNKTIVDEPKVQVKMGIINNGPGKRNRTNDPFNDYHGPAGIEIRGSSSQMFPKKSFGFEIWDINGVDSTASILGMPEEEDWILYAPYTDKSLLRNSLSFKIANEMGNYASRTRFCELIINDQYQGIYVMMEKVKRDKNRVALNKLNPDEVSGENVTGGYIIKIDKTTGVNSGEGWLSPYAPPHAKKQQKVFFQYEYPKVSAIVQEQKNYIQKYVTDFEEVLAGPDFSDEENGYRTYIDINSFIDYAILNELNRNIDGYRLSTFLYKDKNKKLFLGPVWDFNLAFGNADYCRGSDIEGWAWDFNAICSEDGFQIPFWWRRFLEDESFVAAFIDRWESLRQNSLETSRILNYIDSMAFVLDESQKRNFQKWPVLGKYIWPNNFIGQTYQEEINYLKNWITSRTSWIDENIHNIFRVTAQDPEISNSKPVLEFYPNPFNNQANILVKLPAGVTGQLSILDLLGRQVYYSSIDDSTSNTTWDGIDSYGHTAPPGIYLVKLTGPGNFQEVKKIIKH